jgi:hypothetical protein
MSFTVNSGTTDTSAKTVNNSDTGTIQANGTLSASTAITWTGGSVSPGVVINNSGTVTATTRDIDTSSSFNSASLTVNNHAGALMIASGNDAIRVDTSVNTGTLTIDNAGKLVSGALNAAGTAIVAHSSGQAIDLSSITNSTYTTHITNESGALLGASGSDAIDLGYGNVTVSNAGTIDATASDSRAINMDGDTTNHITTFSLTNTGTIKSQDDAVRLSGSTKSTTATGTISVDNSGTIESTATGSGGGQAIDFDDLKSASAHITITNEKTGIITSASNDAMRPGTEATVNNYGHITSTASDTMAIDLANSTGNTINNYAGGVIEGAKHAIDGASSQTIYNAGTLTGDLGSGVNLDTLSTDPMSHITNAATGTITGTAAGAVRSGDAIDVDGLVQVDNYGTIHTVGTSTVSTNEAITVGGGNINNYSGGVIHSVQNAIDVDGGTDSVTGAELNDFSAVTVYNEGTIISDNNIAVSIFGSFGDTITNKGSITGLISTGAGNDTFNLYGGSTITGTIDGGTGTDVINLLGTGSGTVANVVNVETVNVSSGSWTLASEGFTTVHFAAAGLTLGLANATLTDGHYTGTFTGLAATDAFDLKGIGTATSATVGAGNVLTIVGGSTITLQLDPSQSFAGHTFHVTADGAGGSLITMA